MCIRHYMFAQSLRFFNTRFCMATEYARHHAYIHKVVYKRRKCVFVYLEPGPQTTRNVIQSTHKLCSNTRQLAAIKTGSRLKRNNGH